MNVANIKLKWFFQGFVDGDLIETFLDLGREKMSEVADQVSFWNKLLRLFTMLDFLFNFVG